MRESSKGIYKWIDDLANARNPKQVGRAMHFTGMVIDQTWVIKITQGDDGSVFVTARKEENGDRKIIGFDCTRYDDYSDPSPIYVGTNNTTSLDLMLNLMDSASWRWTGGTE